MINVERLEGLEQVKEGDILIGEGGNNGFICVTSRPWIVKKGDTLRVVPDMNYPSDNKTLEECYESGRGIWEEEIPNYLFLRKQEEGNMTMLMGKNLYGYLFGNVNPERISDFNALLVQARSRYPK